MQQQTEAAPPYTDAQLHARACVRCGRSDGELLPARHVRTEDRPGTPLVWAVVACPNHQDWDAPC
jgi:hypothetical protein